MIEKNKMKDYVKQIFNITKNKIIEQAKLDLSGEEKKLNVDNVVVNFVKYNCKTTNPLGNALMNVLLECIPILTQCIYEYLKKYVDGLTEVRG